MFNHSGPAPALKLTNVIGNNNKELANMGEITPAVFIFNGKMSDELATLPPFLLLSFWILNSNFLGLFL